MQIRIYQDLGVSQEGIRHISYSIKKILKKQSFCISAKEILQGDWCNKVKLLIIPGGADTPYTNLLNGVGNKIIKDFILKGGSLLGICAGSYYCAKKIVFTFYDRTIIANRELKLFPGIVKGPVLSDYFENSCRGVRVAKIFLEYNKNHYTECYVFYNGGGYFVNTKNFPETYILARYNNSYLYPAIIRRDFGHGKVVLSGVHFEYDYNLFTDNSLIKIKNFLQCNDNERIKLFKHIFSYLLI